MNFALDEDQALFQAAIERFVADGGRRGATTRDRWADLAGLGLLALPASAERDGLGGAPVDCAVAAMALGRGIAAEPWLDCAYWPLRLLEGVPGTGGISAAIMAGDTRAAVAFAEPAGRYRTAPCDMRAIRGASGWALAGDKHFVLGGDGADLYLVTARDDDGDALFAVRDAARWARAYTMIDGGRAVALSLHEGACRTVERLGPLGGALDDAVAETRLIAAAEIVGLASRLFDDTLDYVRQRRQFGQPLGSFQAVQHRLVDCYAMLEQMRSMLWRAAMAERNGGDGWRATYTAAKAFIAERARHIGHEAIQLHGGMGMSDELAIGHAHKRVVLLSRLFGDPATDLATLAVAA